MLGKYIVGLDIFRLSPHPTCAMVIHRVQCLPCLPWCKHCIPSQKAAGTQQMSCPRMSQERFHILPTRVDPSFQAILYLNGFKRHLTKTLLVDVKVFIREACTIRNVKDW